MVGIAKSFNGYPKDFYPKWQQNGKPQARGFSWATDSAEELSTKSGSSHIFNIESSKEPTKDLWYFTNLVSRFWHERRTT
jgi:hypothetical protein